MRAMTSVMIAASLRLRRQARADHLHGAADRGQRVLDFVRDHRRHLAEPRQRGRLAQPLLELGAARQVVKDAGEVLLAVDLELADRQVQREVLAVAPQRGDGAADADDLPLAGAQVMLDIAVVLRAVRLRHQQADVLAEHVGFAIAEHALGRGVEGLDAAGRIDHDDAVDGGVDDGAPARVGDAQCVDAARSSPEAHRAQSTSPSLRRWRRSPRAARKTPPPRTRRMRRPIRGVFGAASLARAMLHEPVTEGPMKKAIAIGMLGLALVANRAAAQTAAEQAQILRDFQQSVVDYTQRDTSASHVPRGRQRRHARSEDLHAAGGDGLPSTDCAARWPRQTARRSAARGHASRRRAAAVSGTELYDFPALTRCCRCCRRRSSTGLIDHDLVIRDAERRHHRRGAARRGRHDHHEAMKGARDEWSTEQRQAARMNRAR